MEHPRIATSRSEEVRARNDRIAEVARRNGFGTAVRVPLLCECDESDCQSFVRISLPDYDDARERCIPLVTAGHEFALPD